ncbi:Ribosome biogenesis protein TSR3-like [Porphyridium purpureum]|uniref:18S rRNA aminocarboxypropyltransferase n=1 Tax=Porphyridium purpureum TaxID=35688 RepID=A0A5J4YUK5_PORPP|nr:Ribosome biogenesis protein TSR3-like [Porphyridium purpureum]|eukprot:POR7549..scf229_5
MAAVRLYMLDMRQCDARRCSGRKLERLQLLQSRKIGTRCTGLVLSPRGTQLLSFAEDQQFASSLGVIDCSWAQLDTVPFEKMKGGVHRLLPVLLAANPTNFGRAFRLNCAEALAAALVLLRRPEEADKVLAPFKWGPGFLTLNKEFFDKYIQCRDRDEVLAAHRAFLVQFETRRETSAEWDDVLTGIDGFESSDEPKVLDHGPNARSLDPKAATHGLAARWRKRGDDDSDALDDEFDDDDETHSDGEERSGSDLDDNVAFSCIRTDEGGKCKATESRHPDFNAHETSDLDDIGDIG